MSRYKIQHSFLVAFNLSIRNSRNFDYSAHGTMESMAKDTITRMNFFGRLHALHSSGKGASMGAEERNACYSAMACPSKLPPLYMPSPIRGRAIV